MFYYNKKGQEMVSLFPKSKGYYFSLFLHQDENTITEIFFLQKLIEAGKWRRVTERKTDDERKMA